MSEKVYVLTICHRHGDHVSVHRTEEGALKRLAAYCRDYWYEDGPGRNDGPDEPGEEVPPDEVLRLYYEKCDDDEGATIEGVELED